MCADPDKATTDEYRSRKGRQRAYKVIYKRTGTSFVYGGRFTYRPGPNIDRRAAKTYRGYLVHNRGLHCFTTRKAAMRYCGEWTCNSPTVVCVTYDPADVIAAEDSHYGKLHMHNSAPQVVVRSLHISDRAWKQAGLPVTKERIKR